VGGEANPNALIACPFIATAQNARTIPRALRYNDDAKDGLCIDGKRQLIYAKAELPLQSRIAAANGLTR